MFSWRSFFVSPHTLGEVKDLNLISSISSISQDLNLIHIINISQPSFGEV
jgi:hypothetical protein